MAARDAASRWFRPLGVTVRAAVPPATGEFVRLRLGMHREVGDLPDGADPALQADAVRRYFEETLPTGEFRASP